MKHLIEDCLETYLLGRLPGQIDPEREDTELDSIEEHLLLCAPCIERAELLEATMAAIRHALLLPERRAPRKEKLKVSTAAGSFS